MSDVTCIQSAIENGDPHAAEPLLPLKHDELGKLAAACSTHEFANEMNVRQKQVKSTNRREARGVR
jgi:hypothetical protein